MFKALGRDAPLLALFENQFSAGSLFMNFGVNVQQLDWLAVAEGFGIPGDAANGDAIGIQGNLVAGNGFK